MKKVIFCLIGLALISVSLSTDAFAEKYRLEIDISFDKEQDAIDLLNHVEDIKAKSYKPTGIEKIPTYRKTRYHKCFHDDAVPVQCGNYINVDFNKEKKVYTTEVTP